MVIASTYEVHLCSYWPATAVSFQLVILKDRVFWVAAIKDFVAHYEVGFANEQH